MNIGIGITTRNRPAELKECLENIKLNSSYEHKLVVVDDFGEVPAVQDGYDIIRFDSQRGIAAAKNECLRQLHDCDHIFLFDDDCWPIEKGWEDAYILAAKTNEYEALCLTWDSKEDGELIKFHEQSPDFRTVHDLVKHLTVPEEHRLKFHKNPCGVMMYLTRKCIETVGGFCEDFGFYGGEHRDYFVRARNMGMVPLNFPDVENSLRFFRALDRELNHSTASSKERGDSQKSDKVETMTRERINCEEKWELN